MPRFQKSGIYATLATWLSAALLAAATWLSVLLAATWLSAALLAAGGCYLALCCWRLLLCSLLSAAGGCYLALCCPAGG